MVDDGSTDNSANIIKKWQKRFSNNITYLYKENGGISSARNLGLQHVKTEWVTFIDSDDKVHLDYFRIIDKVLAEQSNIGLAVGNLHFYFEENQSIQDTHSLNYRFNKNLNIVPIKDLGKNINLFVTVSFFKTDILHKNNIIFDDKIKPNFEDGKFIADYFLYADTQNVAYVRGATFYYRKRGDGSSTIDNSWLKREKYLNIANYGYLPMLEQYQKNMVKSPKIFSDNTIDIDILLEFIQQAKIHENWQLLEQRLNKLFTLKNDSDIEIDTSTHHDDYLLALFNQNKLLAMLYYLSNQKIKNSTHWLQQINENIHNINPDFQGFIEQHGLVISDVIQKLFELLQKHQKENLDNLKIYLINILVSQKSWQHLNEIFANQPALQKSMTYEYGLTQCRLGNFYGLDKKLPKPEFGHSYEYWQLMSEIALLNDNTKLQKHCYKGMIAFYPDRDKEANLRILSSLIIR